MKHESKNSVLYHESAYGTMKKNGISCWEKLLSPQNKEIDIPSKKFLTWIFKQKWFPKNGKAIELGCGTAPILRMVCRRGLKGLGIDISKTAIYLARKQTKEGDIRFKTVNICSAGIKPGKFDVVIDGHCLHCITSASARNNFFKNVSNLTSENGILIIMTMCGPVDKTILTKNSNGHKIVNHTLFIPFGKKRKYIPVRKILPRGKISGEIKNAGFDIIFSRYIKPADKDPFGTFMAAARK